MKTLNWKQIALGIAVDVGSMIVLIVGLIGTLLILGMKGRTLDIDEKVFDTTPMLILMLVIGLSTLFLGAYVAATRSNSKKSAITHACVMAIISTAVLSLVYLVEPNTEPLWYNVLSYSLILPTAICGGLWRWRNLQYRHRVLDSTQPPIPLP